MPPQHKVLSTTFRLLRVREQWHKILIGFGSGIPVIEYDVVMATASSRWESEHNLD
jgi:hypothetical protein